jgi:hypothetical protein
MVRQTCKERELKRKNRMSEDPEYAERRRFQREKAELKRKKRMSEDPEYAEMKRLQKEKADAKHNKTAERILKQSKRYKAGHLPLSKILPMAVAIEILHPFMGSLMALFELLLMAKWGGRNGLPIHTDAAAGNSPACSIIRPAVTRIHFALRCHEANMSLGQSRYEFRWDYGAGTGSVGTDLRYAEIRWMTPEMFAVGEAIRQYLLENPSLFPGKMDLSKEFNSATALFYMGEEALPEGKGSSLGFHCDSVYKASGEFNQSQNTQAPGTAVVGVNLGDSRLLKFIRRYVSSNGKGWDIAERDVVVGEFLQEHGSIFLLHPEDERPKKRWQTHSSQFQHGGIQVKKGLSLALIFRVVTAKAEVNTVTNRKKLEEKEMFQLENKVKFHTNQVKTVRQHHEDARQKFLERKDALELAFKTFANERIQVWGWPRTSFANAQLHQS